MSRDSTAEMHIHCTDSTAAGKAGSRRVAHRAYFKLLSLYSDIWARYHCRVILTGEENIDPARHRIYIVNHPTTYDLPLLAHIAKSNFYVVVAEDAFAHPLLGWLFRNAGFIELKTDSAETAIRQASEIVKSGKPLIYSLKGYGVDLGHDVRPRTGGIRIAYYGCADIFPIHLMIERGKRIFRQFKKSRTEVYPYTVFSDTLYFMTFCAPIRYTDYAKKDMQYDDFKKIAYCIESTFNQTQARIEQQLNDDPEYTRGLKRRGGSVKKVFL